MMGFLSPKMPSAGTPPTQQVIYLPPEPVADPEPMPEYKDAAAEANESAAAAERKRRQVAAARGGGSTILTGGSIVGTAPVKQKTLLGV